MPSRSSPRGGRAAAQRRWRQQPPGHLGPLVPGPAGADGFAAGGGHTAAAQWRRATLQRELPEVRGHARLAGDRVGTLRAVPPIILDRI
eukprot:5399232-Alexandrium_andersonii.AAC.1